MYRKLLTHFTTASVRETPQELFTNFIIIIIIVMCFSFAAAGAVTAYHQLLNEWLTKPMVARRSPVWNSFKIVWAVIFVQNDFASSSFKAQHFPKGIACNRWPFPTTISLSLSSLMQIT
uniref:Uncharacterized protein n=1 Tax=Glossina austeni TaxID=7395 RepID=A0A1A9VDK6_GLOAU